MWLVQGTDGQVSPPTAGSRGAIPRTCIQEAPHQASKQPEIRAKQKTFFICLSNKYGASMRNRWPIITTHSPTLVLPYLSWFKGGIHAPATQTNRDTLKATEYCWPRPQVQGYHDERKALHPHSKPYSVLALPWLSLGGRGNLTLWQPRWTPSEPPNNHRYTQNKFYVVCLIVI